MQRTRLTRMTILPLNLVNWREYNEKSPDDHVWVNTVTLHNQCPYGEAVWERNQRMKRIYTMEFTFERDAIEAHWQRKSVYCDRILDVCLAFWGILTAMTTYATRRKILALNWHQRSQFRPSKYQSCEIQVTHRYLQCYERWWFTWIPAKARAKLSSMSVESTADAATDTYRRFRTSTSCEQQSSDQETSELLIDPAVLCWPPTFLSSDMATWCPKELHWGPTNTETYWSQGYLYFINRLCIGEEDTCRLNFDLLRFQLRTSCW